MHFHKFTLKRKLIFHTSCHSDSSSDEHFWLNLRFPPRVGNERPWSEAHWCVFKSFDSNGAEEENISGFDTHTHTHKILVRRIHYLNLKALSPVWRPCVYVSNSACICLSSTLQVKLILRQINSCGSGLVLHVQQHDAAVSEQNIHFTPPAQHKQHVSSSSKLATKSRTLWSV